MIFDVAGKRQLILWHPRKVASLDPRSGERHWEVPFSVQLGMTVATTVLAGNLLLVSSFYDESGHDPGCPVSYDSSAVPKGERFLRGPRGWPTRPAPQLTSRSRSS